MKSVYLRFMSDESSDANTSELMRIQSENVKLVQQISAHEYEMKKIAQELKAEKSKNTRLTSKIGVLSTKLKEVKNSKSPQVNWQIICHFTIVFFPPMICDASYLWWFIRISFLL